MEALATSGRDPAYTTPDVSGQIRVEVAVQGYTVAMNNWDENREFLIAQAWGFMESFFTVAGVAGLLVLILGLVNVAYQLPYAVSVEVQSLGWSLLFVALAGVVMGVICFVAAILAETLG